MGQCVLLARFNFVPESPGCIHRQGAWFGLGRLLALSQPSEANADPGVLCNKSLPYVLWSQSSMRCRFARLVRKEHTEVFPFGFPFNTTEKIQTPRKRRATHIGRCAITGTCVHHWRCLLIQGNNLLLKSARFSLLLVGSSSY